MYVNRKQVGEATDYKGHEIIVRHIGPDLMCYVDGAEVPNFFTNAEAARNAGIRYIDLKEREKATNANS